MDVGGVSGILIYKTSKTTIEIRYDPENIYYCALMLLYYRYGGYKFQIRFASMHGGI